MDPSTVNMMLSISMITYIFFLHASIVAHLHNLYHEFYNHTWGGYLYREF